jgi:hypothetical protein
MERRPVRDAREDEEGGLSLSLMPVKADLTVNMRSNAPDPHHWGLLMEEALDLLWTAKIEVPELELEPNNQTGSVQPSISFFFPNCLQSVSGNAEEARPCVAGSEVVDCQVWAMSH